MSADGRNYVCQCYPCIHGLTYPDDQDAHNQAYTQQELLREAAELKEWRLKRKRTWLLERQLKRQLKRQLERQQQRAAAAAKAVEEEAVKPAEPFAVLHYRVYNLLLVEHLVPQKYTFKK